MPETALICRVPEAERFIARYRDRYDPPARRNVPAHVTVLYPFMSPDQVDGEVLTRLRGIAASIPCFSYHLRELRRFPLALYLAPEPDERYTTLMQAVYEAFPAFPPFGGKFETVVPHITVAHGDEPLLCEIEVELRIALPAGAGVPARCTELVLIENTTGRWEQMAAFPLAD